MSALLAIPCTDGPKLHNACAVPARGIILDLEDAIPAEQKPVARAELAACVAAIRNAGKIPYVRINPISTNFWKEDLDAIVGVGIEHLMIAKVEAADEMRALDEAVSKRGLADLRYAVLVESAGALDRLEEVAKSSSRVAHVGIGLGDMCRSHGMTWEVAMTTQRPLVNEWRARLISVSHRCGIEPPWDTVWVRIADQDGLRADATLGRLLGFAGKTAVDPSQVAVINEVYHTA